MARHDPQPLHGNLFRTSNSLCRTSTSLSGRSGRYTRFGTAAGDPRRRQALPRPRERGRPRRGSRRHRPPRRAPSSGRASQRTGRSRPPSPGYEHRSPQPGLRPGSAEGMGSHLETAAEAAARERYARGAAEHASFWEGDPTGGYDDDPPFGAERPPGWTPTGDVCRCGPAVPGLHYLRMMLNRAAVAGVGLARVMARCGGDVGAAVRYLAGAIASAPEAAEPYAVLADLWQEQRQGLAAALKGPTSLPAVLTRSHVAFLENDMNVAVMALGSVTGARPTVAWAKAPWCGDARFLGGVGAEAVAEAVTRTMDHGHDLDTPTVRGGLLPWFDAVSPPRRALRGRGWSTARRKPRSVWPRPPTASGTPVSRTHSATSLPWSPTCPTTRTGCC